MSGRDEETNWKPLSEVKPPLPRLLIPRPRPPPVGHSRAQWPDRPHLKHSLLLMAAVRSSASERVRSGGDSDAGPGKAAHKVAAVYFQGPCLRHTRVCTRPHTRRCARLSSASPTRPISTRSSAVQSEPPPRRAAQLERSAAWGGPRPPRAAAFPAVPRARPFPPGTAGPDSIPGGSPRRGTCVARALVVSRDSGRRGVPEGRSS